MSKKPPREYDEALEAKLAAEWGVTTGPDGFQSIDLAQAVRKGDEVQRKRFAARELLHKRHGMQLAPALKRKRKSPPKP